MTINVTEMIVMRTSDGQPVVYAMDGYELVWRNYYRESRLVYLANDRDGNILPSRKT